MGSILPSAILVLLTASAVVITTVAPQTEEVYFSNRDNIEVYDSGEQILFANAIPVTMDCSPNSNPRDRQVYWISSEAGGVIKRGFPSNRTMEVVLDRDIGIPTGIAVDWSTNNIYFSHITNEELNMGRVEVISGDGQKRRALFYGIQGDKFNTATGAVTVNVLTGHLYFVDAASIRRSHLDGTHDEVVIPGLSGDEYNSLNIDEDNNILYWTVTSFNPQSGDEESWIRCLSIAEFEARQAQGASDLTRSQLITRVNDMFVHNFTMYLTIPSSPPEQGKVVLLDVANITWSVSDSLQVTALFSTPTPEGVCTFRNVPDVVSPCSNHSTCASSSFCFPIPDGHGSTVARCSCPTGLMLNAENNRTCASVPEEFLLYSRRVSDSILTTTRSEIRMVPLDGSDDADFVDVLLPFDLNGKDTAYVAYDIRFHKVYWTEASPPCIKRANLNGSQVEVFINTSIARPEGIAVDPYAGNLYWMDARLNTISVTSLANPCHTKTLFEHVDHPQGLALDVIRGYMYWTDVIKSQPEIERARLNGEDHEQISSSFGANTLPTNVAVDMETGFVYWIRTNTLHSTAVIFRWRMETRMEEALHLGGHTLVAPFGLAVYQDHVYWTDSEQRDIERIARISKATVGSVEVIDSNAGALGLIAVNNTQEANSLNLRCRASLCQLCFQVSSTETSCACGDHFSLDPEQTTDNPTNCIDSPFNSYVAFSSSIQNLDFNQNGNFQASSEPAISLGNGTVRAIDGHSSANVVYWIDDVDKTIKRQSLNRTSTDSYEVIIPCCLWQPEDLAVDWLGLNLYWTDSARRVIEVAKLDGSRRVVLVQLRQEHGPPGQIVLDPMRGDIYWSSMSEPKIYRIKMDGSELEPTLFVSYEESEANITALTMVFQKHSGRLYASVVYLDDNNVMKSSVYYNVLGNSEKFPAVQSISSIIADLQTVDDKIYYSRNGRSGLYDLSSRHPLYFSSEPFTKFLILHHSTQPGRHMCQVSSQCEGAESLCLVADGVSRECRCDAFAVRRVLGHEVEDSFECATSDQFLLLATEDHIHYVPLEDRGSETSVRQLPATPNGTLADMVYDPFNNTVLWVTSGSGHVNSVKLDSSAEWSIPVSEDPLQLFSLAYDWRGGHFFLTERDSFELKMAVANGNGRGTMLKITGGKVAKPGQVFVDSTRGILYYTIRDGLSAASRSLMKLSLDDIGNPQELQPGSSRISNITYDDASNSFYWIRHRPGHDKGDIIEKFTERSGVVQVMERASKVEALGALSSSQYSYLYWYNRTDKYLYRHQHDRRNISADSAAPYLMWDVPNTVVKIVGYQKTPIVSQLDCLRSERPCSHLCVDGPGEPSCYCTQYMVSEPNLDVPNAVCRSNTGCGSPLTFACQNEFNSCFPRTYVCDGLRHCSNGYDEMNCTCSSINEQQGCFKNRSQCYNFDERCDGVEQCSSGKDEDDCCEDYQFGCFVRGSYNQTYFNCLDVNSRCDGVDDCLHGTDESNCPTTSSESTTVLMSTRSPSRSVTVAITLAIISIITVVVVVVIVVSVVRLVWKGRPKGRSHHSITYIMTTPHDSNSDYNSEVSQGTSTTNMSHCAGRSKFMMDSSQNPPPSPNSMLCPHTSLHVSRHSLPLSEDDDISRLSQSLSEYAPPPPPCPSINYDNMSMNLSISVSQRGFPASIGPGRGGGGGGGASHGYPGMQQHHHHQYQYHNPQPGPHTAGGGCGPPGRHLGRNPNPLLSNRTTAHTQQQNHYVTFNGEIPYRERDRNCNGAPPPQCNQSNHVPYMYQQRGYDPYPDIISEHDTLTQLETESTLSVPMDNADGYPYDVSMPHLPPPGRPPSPVTMCSEYQGQPPLSPQLSQRSSSTASFSSHD